MGPSFHLGRKNQTIAIIWRAETVTFELVYQTIGNYPPENEINQTRNVQTTGTAIFFVTLKKKFDHSEIVFNLYTKKQPKSLLGLAKTSSNKQHQHSLRTHFFKFIEPICGIPHHHSECKPTLSQCAAVY